METLGVNMNIFWRMMKSGLPKQDSRRNMECCWFPIAMVLALQF